MTIKKSNVHFTMQNASGRSLTINGILAIIVFAFCLTTDLNADTVNPGRKPEFSQDGPKITSVVKHTLADGIKAKKFYAAVSDENKGKWFLTDIGIISGEALDKLVENPSIPLKNLNNMALESAGDTRGLWISSTNGVYSAPVPIESSTEVHTYNIDNSGLLSNYVYSVAVGSNQLRWFVTDKGITALDGEKWFPDNYPIFYWEDMFSEYPVTAVATSNDGDTLYAATEGVGVTRVYRGVDAISGASPLAQWGPIELPSDSVYSICITNDGTQWIGTSQGIGVHTGFVTLEGWKVYDTRNGLVNKWVQAIAADQSGNMWCGTKGGLSVFDGSVWTSFTTEDGLTSNNILFILSDKDGKIYIGTDNGLMIFSGGQLDCYQ